MAEYGLSKLDGLVVEGNSSYHARGFNYYLLPEIESHEATSGLANLYVMLPYAQAIQTSELENVTVDSLLSTSSSAYNKAPVTTWPPPTRRRATRKALRSGSGSHQDRK